MRRAPGLVETLRQKKVQTIRFRWKPRLWSWGSGWWPVQGEQGKFNDRDWSTRGPQVRGQAVSWALPMGRHGRTHRQPVAREKAGQQERWGAPLGLVSITCSRTGVVRQLQPLNAVGRRSADATR